MRATIIITLPDDLRTTLDEAVRETGQSPEEFLCDALRDYLFIRGFRLLREHMICKAQAQGIHTDQDVFDCIS